MPRMQAALQGAREVGFTVLSMSMSLVAVFIPILLMGGIVGRLFREFAVTLSMAILISLVVSLTTTPMMCSRLLRQPDATRRARPAVHRVQRARLRRRCWHVYERTLRWALRHPRSMMLRPDRDDRAQRLSLRHRAEGLLPAAGHRPHDRRHPGRPEHLVPGDAAEAARSSSPSSGTIRRCDSVVGFTGGGQTNRGFVFISLKPLAERKRLGRPGDRAAAPQAGAGARRAAVPAGRCRTSASAAGRATRNTSTRCRPTISPSSTHWAPQADRGAAERARAAPTSTPTSRTRAWRPTSIIDRDTAARLGLTPSADRQHALRRVRPAPGVDHLQRAQPVPRGHGGGAAATGRTRRR